MVAEPKPPRAETNGDLAYWMGKVDTQLVTMNQTLINLTSNDKANWREFNAWRDEVDRRLQDGTANFRRIDDIQAQRDKTLEELRASYAEIMESLKLCQTQRVANIQAREAREQAIKEKENHTVHDSRLDKPINDGESISYRWLLEKIALPVGIAFILWLLLTLLPDLLQHISIP